MSGMMFDSKYNGCVVIHKYNVETCLIWTERLPV